VWSAGREGVGGVTHNRRTLRCPAPLAPNVPKMIPVHRAVEIKRCEGVVT